MDSILEGVASFISSSDTSGKFKTVEYSEYVDDLIKKNKIPFIDVVGLKERKSPLAQFDFRKAYRQEYDITIIIVQDAKSIKKVLHGSESIWSLWNYTWGLIEADRTFGGIVRRIADKTIESKLMTLGKDNSFKICLETELTLIKDVFK